MPKDEYTNLQYGKRKFEDVEQADHFATLVSDNGEQFVGQLEAAEIS